MNGWIYVFDDNGLRFSLEHIQRALREAKSMPVDQLAQYVDQGTFENAQKVVPRVIPDRLPPGVNLTAIGNIAFLMLHSADPEVKRKCSILIEQFKRP